LLRQSVNVADNNESPSVQRGIALRNELAIINFLSPGQILLEPDFVKKAFRSYVVLETSLDQEHWKRVAGIVHRGPQFE
jgi:hypothetical protein